MQTPPLPADGVCTLKYKLHPLAVEGALSLHNEVVGGRVAKYNYRLYDLATSVQDGEEGEAQISDGKATGFDRHHRGNSTIS